MAPLTIMLMGQRHVAIIECVDFTNEQMKNEYKYVLVFFSVKCIVKFQS